MLIFNSIKISHFQFYALMRAHCPLIPHSIYVVSIAVIFRKLTSETGVGLLLQVTLLLDVCLRVTNN
jgi:hypothetical protein